MSQSLSRALQILIELGEGERSLDQVAASLEVHKTTAMRLLHTLEADRFVRRDDRQRYHLGSRLFALGGAALVDGIGPVGRLRQGHLVAAGVLAATGDHARPPAADVRARLLECSEDDWAATRVSAAGIDTPATREEVGPR